MTVSYVRLNSSAHKACTLVRDVLLQINGRKVYNMPLERVLGVLQKEPGERIRLIVEQKGKKVKFNFMLQSFFDIISQSL